MDDRPSLGVQAEVGPLAERKVLVVDDEEDVRTFLLTVFADAGASLCEAASGEEALAVAAVERPDLITLDLSMPGMGGVQAYVALRSHPEIGDIPVCIVTGHPEFRAVIYDRPVRPPEGYLDKPVDPETLVTTVRRILGLKRRRLASRRD
jgi:CheY-like chemotaxis protein